jgi:hypothetical protein
MKRMFLQLGTPENLKRQVAIPNAGEHVLGSYVKSKDLQTVEDECEKFGVEILQLKEKEANNNKKQRVLVLTKTLFILFI